MTASVPPGATNTTGPVSLDGPDPHRATQGENVLPRYWHGGAPSLRVGDLIEPGHDRTIDGCEICAARARGETATVNGHHIDAPTGRPDRVYLTTDREYARFYASLAVRGDLYRVEPVGDIEPSTEDRFDTVTAPAARVIAVYDRAVQLTPGQRRRMGKLWAEADRKAAAS